MAEAEEYELGKLLLVSIGLVFLGKGLANMSSKERRKLAKEAGVTNETLEAYVLGCFAANQIEALAPGEKLPHHPDYNNEQQEG